MELRDAALDIPDHAERVETIDKLIDARLGELSSELQVADQGWDQARAHAAGIGRQSMERLREKITSIEQDESARRDALRDAADVSVRYAMVSLIISSALSCAIMIVGAYVIQREIAARKKLADSLQAADRNKDEFLAVLGHELRNPLAAVRNAIDVLGLLGPPTQSVEEMHGIINRQTAVMRRLVDDLLDVSRITHRKIELRTEQLDVVNLAERTIADTCSAVHGTDVTITLDAPEEPVWVRGDATHSLRQSAIYCTTP